MVVQLLSIVFIGGCYDVEPARVLYAHLHGPICGLAVRVVQVMHYWANPGALEPNPEHLSKYIWNMVYLEQLI